MTAVRPEPSRTPSGTTDPVATVAAGLGRSSLLMLGRRIVVSLLTAATSVVIARSLLPAAFGEYSAAFATYFLLLGLADFGIAQELARRLGRCDDDSKGGSVTTAVRLQFAFSGAAAVVGVVLAAVIGFDDAGAAVLVVLAPALVVNGCAVLRQVYYAEHDVRLLATVDVTVAAVQAALIVALALTFPLPVAFAGAVSGCAVAGNVVVWVAYRRRHRRRAVAPWRPFLRAAVPLGAASSLATAYVTIDLVLLPHLVAEASVGHYAVAVKFVNILVQVPTLIAALSLASMSSVAARGRDETSDLIARVWHWHLVSVVPAALFLGVFSGGIVRLAFGDEFAPAARPLAVLMVAVVVMSVANVLVPLMIAHGRGRVMVIQGVVALLLNVAGNVVLAPRLGIMASAWLTVATEVVIVLSAALVLRATYSVVPAARASWRPLTAAAAIPLVALAVGDSAVGAAAALVAYAALLLVVRGLPREMVPARGRRWLCT